MEKLSLEFQDQNVKSILQHGDGKFVQLSLNPGEGLTKHRTPNNLTVIVLSGRVEFSMDGESVEMSAGDLLPVAPKVEHAISALDKSIVLLVLIPAKEQRMQKAGPYNLDHENAFQNPSLLEGIIPELRGLVDDHVALCKLLMTHPEDDLDATPELLKAVGRELDTHFLAEEEVVFPRIAKYTGGTDVGPVPRLLEEHFRIRNLHSEALKIYDLVLTDADPHAKELLREKITELSTGLLNHLGKEDSHLFPMAGRLFNEEERQMISQQLERYEKLV